MSRGGVNSVFSSLSTSLNVVPMYAIYPLFHVFVIFRVEEQTITAAELITQDIDINEPIGNLKKLLEPRLQVQLDGFDICLQDILVCAFALV